VLVSRSTQQSSQLFRVDCIVKANSVLDLSGQVPTSQQVGNNFSTTFVNRNKVTCRKFVYVGN